MDLKCSKVLNTYYEVVKGLILNEILMSQG